MAVKASRSALLFIFITVMLSMIGLGVVMPVMPDLIMSVTGEDLSHAAQWGGYLTLAYALMQFIMMPIIGGLSDRYGRRPVLLLSMAAYSFDFLVMAVAPTIGIILVARLLAGAFAATFSTANAYIADISPPEKRAANFGLLGAAFGLGFVIGPAIGGVLGEHFGTRAPFYFVAALGAANLVFGYFVLPETLAPENRRNFAWARANALGNLKEFANYPVMLPIAGVLFISQLAHWTYPSVWAYFANERFGWSAGAIAASLSFVGLSAAVVQGGLTRIIVPKFGEAATAVFAMGVAMLSYVAFALVTTGWMVYVLIAFSALGGLAGPALQGIMSRTMPANAQGELQGAIAAVMSISMVISPWMMTQIFSAFIEPGTPFSIFGVTLALNGAPFYFPGAPFVFSAILEMLAICLLFYAVRHIQRPAGEALAG
ncbi:MAG: TCR/Tet family MFS transporter [Hyphococcus sp.]